VIFATVGTQLPFPRLLAALDRIARAHSLNIVAQTCEPDGHYPHLTASAHIDPSVFESNARAADRLVSHAGIGTILTARRTAKPLILFPRRASMGEHRNEHQLATVHSVANRRGIYIALDEAELESLLLRSELVPLRSEDSAARAALISRLKGFIGAG
jgi:UDP-N-acetylglucosamine transferase subunit ALG13